MIQEGRKCVLIYMKVVAVPDERDQWIKDEILMERVARKDEKALQILYARFAPLLHHIALKSLDKGAAEDLVQEVFFAIWTKSGDFDPIKGNFRNWILQIAHFRILNELRRRGRRPALNFEDMDILADTANGRSDPPEETWKSFRVDAVREAIEHLPGPQRQALQLAFFDDLSHEEVADALGLPLGTVKGRIRLALRKLRRRLIPVALGFLAVWGAGASIWAVLSIDDAAARGDALAFITGSGTEVKRLTATDGSVSGSCSYDTRRQAVVLALEGLKKPETGRLYRLWARWDGDWVATGDLTWEKDGRGYLQVKDPRWSREPRLIEVTIESAGREDSPSGPIIVGAEL